MTYAIEIRPQYVHWEARCYKWMQPHMHTTYLWSQHEASIYGAHSDLAVSCKIERNGDLSKWPIMLLSLVQFPELNTYKPWVEL